MPMHWRRKECSTIESLLAFCNRRLELDELLECSQGESGTAVVFHLSKEEAYVKFLQIRRVPLQERECSNNAPDIIPQVGDSAV
ncbi:DEAD-box ATP-dependent RNA helicase 18-like [Spinacia oleracea]|uniref:DEAD-box ATP-dependent RNA helicase 18-like n=1 Tax=Spinacia oleracea TaxID=3562 RepID=A0ABM3QKA9_SPIOL|nr:DEAD-box ATP-dependent RNA helicase 18-like [Spinacia oleracea]